MDRHQSVLSSSAWRDVRRLAAGGLAAGLFVLSAAACGGGGSGGGGGGLSASEIVSRSAVATAKQTSFHLVVSMQQVATSKTGMTLTFVDGDLVVPSRLRANVGGTFQGVPLKSELVVIGGAHYLKDPFSGTWQRVSLGTSPVAFFDPAKGVLAVIKGARGLALNGSERVGGVDCDRVTGKVRTSALRPLLGNPGSSKLVPVELWIGHDDSLLRRIRLSGVVVPGDGAGAVRTVELSNYGEHVSIVAPQVGS